MGIHRTWASGLEPFMGPPVGRARSPPGLAPIIVGAGGYSPPRETRNPPPGTFGRPVSALLAIFHIREPCALNTISNIIGFAVAAGHRLLTRTREQEPMGRLRRTRTREPPGGAQSSPAQDSWPGSSRRETRELEDGWMARTRAHPPRRLATARGESEITEAHCPASPTPSPQKRAYLLGCASGSRDGWAGGPQVQVPPVLEGGLGLVMGCFLHHLRPLF
jgi:hypothetical protein